MDDRKSLEIVNLLCSEDVNGETVKIANDYLKKEATPEQVLARLKQLYAHYNKATHDKFVQASASKMAAGEVRKVLGALGLDNNKIIKGDGSVDLVEAAREARRRPGSHPTLFMSPTRHKAGLSVANSAQERLKLRHKQLHVLLQEGTLQAEEAKSLTNEDIAKIFADRKSLMDKTEAHNNMIQATKTSTLQPLFKTPAQPHPPPNPTPAAARAQMTGGQVSPAEINELLKIDKMKGDPTKPLFLQRRIKLQQKMDEIFKATGNELHPAYTQLSAMVRETKPIHHLHEAMEQAKAAGNFKLYNTLNRQNHTVSDLSTKHKHLSDLNLPGAMKHDKHDVETPQQRLQRMEARDYSPPAQRFRPGVVIDSVTGKRVTNTPNVVTTMRAPQTRSSRAHQGEERSTTSYQMQKKTSFAYPRARHLKATVDPRALKSRRTMSPTYPHSNLISTMCLDQAPKSRGRSHDHQLERESVGAAAELFLAVGLCLQLVRVCSQRTRLRPTRRRPSPGRKRSSQLGLSRRSSLPLPLRNSTQRQRSSPMYPWRPPIRVLWSARRHSSSPT